MKEGSKRIVVRSLNSFEKIVQFVNTIHDVLVDLSVLNSVLLAVNFMISIDLLN